MVDQFAIFAGRKTFIMKAFLGTGLFLGQFCKGYVAAGLLERDRKR